MDLESLFFIVKNDVKHLLAVLSNLTSVRDLCASRVILGYIGVILVLYRDYTGIMEKKMETTI